MCNWCPACLRPRECSSKPGTQEKCLPEDDDDDENNKDDEKDDEDNDVDDENDNDDGI